MICRLCGFEYEVASLSCHSGCPFGDKCHLVCCPNCGYQVVDDSRSGIVRWVTRLVGSRKPTSDGPDRARRVREDRLVPLSHVAPGSTVTVRRLDDMSESRLSRLLMFGLAPGSSVRLVQLTPAPVLLVGETELALGTEVLDQIWVDPPPGDSRSDGRA